MRNESMESIKELVKACKELVASERYDECKKIIYHSMSVFPNNPEPHNLLGVVLEKTGEHMLAMNHFRAAWALDPTYAPAIANLNTLGDLMSFGSLAMDDEDCSRNDDSDISIKYDEYGVGHVVRRRTRR